VPAYVMLMNLTDQGIREVKNSPERIKQGMQAFEAVGGKVTAFFVVLGEYDMVAIGEAPSDEAAMGFALGLCRQGNVRTTTLRAFTPEQYAGIVSKLP
jgi:uncharacterized protein with GYD domain